MTKPLAVRTITNVPTALSPLYNLSILEAPRDHVTLLPKTKRVLCCIRKEEKVIINQCSICSDPTEKDSK